MMPEICQVPHLPDIFPIHHRAPDLMIGDAFITFNAGANWWKGGWDPKFNSELRSVTEVQGDLGISKEMKPSNVPSSIGDIGGSITSEAGGKYTEYKMKQEGGGK